MRTLLFEKGSVSKSNVHLQARIVGTHTTQLLSLPPSVTYYVNGYYYM